MSDDKKRTKLMFWIFTGLLSIQMLLSAGIYFFGHEIALEAFTKLGFPTYIIYPLGIAKIAGLIAIISRKSLFLARLAYAGFFYNLILAVSAHLAIGEILEAIPAALAIVWVIGSFRFSQKMQSDVG